ncbi:hypothetical protein D5H75_21470 [Bailinhaonella thermotolerans]|uniref:Uncharacterized protein n=1 Tax=Bailinhaonella thermotolerans TaxID=1070861 RepID=A0A3A4AYF4_9ACTN|nr:hypothetical protein D5H75_21470 [Bailinhaonella thermotolerans]
MARKKSILGGRPAEPGETILEIILRLTNKDKRTVKIGLPPRAPGEAKIGPSAVLRKVAPLDQAAVETGQMKRLGKNTTSDSVNPGGPYTLVVSYRLKTPPPPQLKIDLGAFRWYSTPLQDQSYWELLWEEKVINGKKQHVGVIKAQVTLPVRMEKVS